MPAFGASLTMTWANGSSELSFTLGISASANILLRFWTLSPKKFGENTDAMKERFKTMIPMGRMGKPEEIAAAAVFRVSDESSHWSRACGRRWHRGGLSLL